MRDKSEGMKDGKFIERQKDVKKSFVLFFTFLVPLFAFLSFHIVAIFSLFGGVLLTFCDFFVAFYHFLKIFFLFPCISLLWYFLRFCCILLIVFCILVAITLPF
jgi:hypothetical protein